jgi:hypothetical protein
MQDLSLDLENVPGALALFGETLGRAGVSVEGGGAWVVSNSGTAHFLVEDGARAAAALTAVGVHVLACRDVVTLRLRQDEPGQLGKICRRLAEAGVNIEVLYSDHAHRLVLVAAPLEKARQVALQWTNESLASRGNVGPST